MKLVVRTRIRAGYPNNKNARRIVVKTRVHGGRMAGTNHNARR